MRAHLPVSGDRPSCVHSIPVARAPIAPSLFARIRLAFTTRRQRHALMALDDRMLADIGLSRSQAYREANRGFLDLPPLS